MTERDALLAAVLADPENDTPRLVFADYLEENGEADRAWFIRFQCDPLNQGTHNGEKEYAIAERYVEEWFGLRELSGRKRNRKSYDWYFADYGPPNLRFRWGRRDRYGRSVWVELPIRRGFFAESECPPEWWLALGDALTAAHPVRRVRLTDRPGFAFAAHRDFVCQLGTMSGAPHVEVPVSDVRAGIRRDGSSAWPIDADRWVRATLRLRWPGVEFEMPPDDPLERGFRAAEAAGYGDVTACVRQIIGPR